MAEHKTINCYPRTKCPTGYDLLQDPLLNKGISFTDEERKRLKIEGLLPPGYNSIEDQIVRTMKNFRKKQTDIAKYSFIMDLMERDLTLFHRVVLDNLTEMMPIVYTPTVGRASQNYSHIFQRPQGVFLAEKYRGRFREILANWPLDDVRIVVVTDGERILGLGDLGVSGMAIPLGKSILYVACAGIHPHWCLPVTLDVGTNNASLLNDPLYLGHRHKRLRGSAYDDLVDEFVQAVLDRYPDALIHFEDFGNANAFRLLQKYRDRICTFNDDIQGTAAVALAGLFAAAKLTRVPLKDQKILFMGAGGAGIGIGELIVTAMMKEGLSEDEARRRCWFVDSKGLVVRQREHLNDVKRAFAHDFEYIEDLASSVRALKPTAIIGVSGQPGKFTPQVLSDMAQFNERPVVFALSNPTSKSECTAEEAYIWTRGSAVFASGSPFGPVTMNGSTYVPGQGNNAYIFPGVGLGAVVSRATRITDEMFLAAASTLADMVTPEEFRQGCVYPPLTSLRQVSIRIAAAVAEVAFEMGLARIPVPDDLQDFVETNIYAPEYASFVNAVAGPGS